MLEEEDMEKESMEASLKEGIDEGRVVSSERGRQRVMEAWKGVGGDTKAM